MLTPGYSYLFPYVFIIQDYYSHMLSPPQPRGFVYSEGVERFSRLCGQKYKQPPAELTRSLCIKTSSGSSFKWSMLGSDLHDGQSHQFLCPIQTHLDMARPATKHLQPFISDLQGPIETLLPPNAHFLQLHDDFIEDRKASGMFGIAQYHNTHVNFALYSIHSIQIYCMHKMSNSFCII